VADVLAEMLPVFAEITSPGGRLILSGIISIRREKVLDALEKNGFAATNVVCENDWVAIEAKKA